MRVIGENGEQFEISDGPVAYIGNANCMNAMCRHRYDGEGHMLRGCLDYHCPRCHEPCPMYGHDCEDTCLCGVSAPDEFGNYDSLEHPDCPLHGPAPKEAA